MSTALVPWKRNRRWSVLWAGVLAVIALFAVPIPASASEGTLVQISNRNSGLCMSLPGDVVVAGARIDQWQCGGYLDQYWYWNPSDSCHPGWGYLQPQQNDTLCATYVPGSTIGDSCLNRERSLHGRGRECGDDARSKDLRGDPVANLTDNLGAVVP